MILFFNKNKDFIIELSKDQLLFAEDEIKLNDQWVAEIGYPFSYNNKDFSYFGYFYDGNFYMYKIIENKNEDGRIYLKGIHIFFDEMQGHVIRDKKPKNKTVQSICDDVFKEVDWNFVSSVQGLGTTNFYHISYLDAFDKILKTWNCEFYLEIKLSGGKISQKNVILKNDISVNHGKWFEYTSNLVSVIAEQNHASIFTAFIGRGKGEETENGGFGRKIKFDKIAWSVANGDPVNKPIGQDYVELKEATKLFGYPDGKPRTTVVDFDDEEDRENLLKLTYEYALENSRPKLLLKAKVYSNEKVEIGEIATIIRDDLDIRYQTKIIKINRNLLNDEKDIEVGDEVQSSIQRIKGIESKQKEQIEEIESRLEQALKNVDFDFNNEDGYNYDLKAGNKYNLPAGYYSFNKPIDENPTKVVYMGAGKVLIADEKGSDGSWKWKTAIDGNGIYGSEIVTHSITANKLASDVGQSLDLSSNKSINLTVKKTTQSYIDKNKDQLKGADGKDGLDGVPGKDGIGITSTTIEYAVNQSGTTKPTAGWSGTVPKTNPGDYIWTKTTWKYTDNTSEEAYSVGRIGADGPDGNDGLPGAPGVGIKKTTITYAKSTSGTVIPPSTATWSPSPPAGNPGEFIWTKTVWTYTNNETEEGYSVGMIGKTGARGAKGDKGDKGEADYTVFRTEFNAELKNLGDSIKSKVSATDFTETNEKINERFTEINQKADSIEFSIADKTDSSDVKNIFSSMTLTDRQIKSVTDKFTIESRSGTYRNEMKLGNFTSYKDGYKQFEVNKRGLEMYERGERVTELATTVWSGNGSNNFRLGHRDSSMTISYHNAKANAFSPYITFDKYNTSGFLARSDYPIKISQNVEMSGDFWMKRGYRLWIGDTYYLTVGNLQNGDHALYLTRDNGKYGLALVWNKLYFIKDYQLYEIFKA